MSDRVCQNCGTNVGEQAKYCPECGEAVQVDKVVAPCLQCKEPISVEAEKCPHCGWNPSERGQKSETGTAVVGWLLIMTVVGAPIGYLMIKGAQKHEENMDGKPTKLAPGDIAE